MHGSQDVDDRVCVHDACAWLYGPDRLDPGDGRTHEVRLQNQALTPGKGRKDGLIARGPGEERGLVHRGVEGHAVALLLDVAGKSPCEASEAIHKVGAQGVDVVGPAVVADVPDHEYPVLLRRPQERLDGGKVEATGRALDQMPADAVSGGTHAELREQRIVCARTQVVLELGRIVQAAAAAVVDLG
jgi:hypothetical protein